jgi:hypothetical protein
MSFAPIWNYWRCNRNARTIIIPASVTELLRDSFQDSVAEEILFESGSGLFHLGPSMFGLCKWLKYIRIPASVESIAGGCFLDLYWAPPLERVTFESGSKLRLIEGMAFYRCYSLRTIFHPASVQFVDGLSFAECGLREIRIDTANPFIHV